MSRRSVRVEVQRQLDLLRVGAIDFYGEEELRERLTLSLEEGRPLRVKLGMDPSSPDLHLGHTIVLSKLKCFQELGHTPIFLVGDFTARIGDPSGRNKTRPALGEEEVKQNASTYVEQVARILDVERAEVRFNSEWMEQLSLSEFVRLCSRYTVARLLERDDFAKRYKAEEPISVHEFLYPFVQAYDSVVLRSDVELGGSDQTFNLLMAREIQRDYGQAPQAVITHPLLVGTDGHEKMSKSLGNSIGIEEAPEEIYGKLMSLSDTLMLDYIDQLGFGEWADLDSAGREVRRGGGDPLALKHQLASRVVARLHGSDAAQSAEDRFRKVVQRRELPDDIPETTLEIGPGADLGLIEILERLKLTETRSEARRLVSQGAVQIDNQRVGDPTRRLAAGSYLIRVGKRRFARIQIQP